MKTNTFQEQFSSSSSGSTRKSVGMNYIRTLQIACPPLRVQKEIAEIENKSFEDTLKENNEIISFGEDEDDSNYRIDEECEEDPLSVDADNINRWDYDADGDKVDIEGNKFLFED